MSLKKNNLYLFKPKVKKLKSVDPTHFLFIGNSYLYYGDGIHNHVKRMARSNKEFNKKNNAFMSITMSNGGLHEHSIDSYLTPGKLHIEEPFQVVILQEGSALGWDDDRLILFKKTISEYITKIRKAGGEPVLYMTHAYVKPHPLEDPKMTERLNKIYTEAGNEFNVFVIPVGLAFAEAYNRNREITLHKKFDGTHPSLLGSMLAASTVYASIFGNPIGNKYNYFGEIAENELSFIHRVAKDTVDQFYKD